jgi:hypothetical protein
MIEKIVNAKVSSQVKQLKSGPTTYSSRQLYIYFNQRDIDALHMDKGDTVYISKDAPAPATADIANLSTNSFKVDVIKMLQFFQRNKSRLIMSTADREYFKELMERLKNE